MWQIAFAAAVAWLAGAHLLPLVSSRKITNAALTNSLAYLAVITFLAAVNFEFDFFEQKYAGSYAYDVFKGADHHATFVVPAAANSLAFLVTHAWWAAIGTNVAVLALIKAYIYTTSSRLSMIMWAPGIVNFALYSLRDPFIALCMFGLTITLCRPSASVSKKLAEGGWLAMTALLRPEAIGIYLFARIYSAKDQLRRHPLLILFVPVACIMLVVGATYLPIALGYSGRVNFSSLPHFFNQFFADRANRNDAVVGSSDILGGRLKSLPLPVRYPVQLICFFVLPLPFEIRSVPLALSFVDSIVFILVCRHFWHVGPRRAKILFVVFAFSTAFFVDNYGNLLRLRFPAYFIMAGGLLFAHWQRERRQQDSTSCDVRDS